MNVYFSQLPPAEKLEIYKKVKVICNTEGLDLVIAMEEVVNDKISDIYAAIQEYYNK